jgi:DeoR/GlpR family transcriptional regulator of sugar metabolism
LKLKQISRREKVINLLCSGCKEIEISKALGVSDRTIRRDLKSFQVQNFIDEMLRLQLRDIARERNIEVRCARALVQYIRKNMLNM